MLQVLQKKKKKTVGHCASARSLPISGWWAGEAKLATDLRPARRLTWLCALLPLLLPFCGRPPVSFGIPEVAGIELVLAACEGGRAEEEARTLEAGGIAEVSEELIGAKLPSCCS
eukprot:gb/GEZN01010252.1/.p3 GENE.gb/GEZN01010252.1/~~gb/GEZN01010252.1/.p3  ORF type:complete len:115 (+),score=21.12 gb/GEZN01010252.1/:513-857(+)